MRMSLPRFSKEHFGANLELVAKFKELAAKKGCSAGQLCLAWLMAQEGGQSISFSVLPDRHLF